MGMTRTGTAREWIRGKKDGSAVSRASRLPNGENLDISWLRDESLQSGDDLPEPEVIATEIMEKLRIATKEMEALMVLLEGEEAAEAVSASVGLPTVE